MRLRGSSLLFSSLLFLAVCCSDEADVPPQEDSRTLIPSSSGDMEAANALEFCYKNLTLAEFDRMDSDPLRHNNKAFFVTTTLFGCDCLRCCGFVEIVDVFSSSASAMSTSALSVSCTAENLLNFTQVRRRSNHPATLEGKNRCFFFFSQTTLHP